MLPEDYACLLVAESLRSQVEVEQHRVWIELVTSDYITSRLRIGAAHGPGL